MLVVIIQTLSWSRICVLCICMISFKKMVRYERSIEIFKTISYVVFQDQSLEASQISICDKKWRRWYQVNSNSFQNRAITASVSLDEVDPTQSTSFKLTDVLKTVASSQLLVADQYPVDYSLATSQMTRKSRKHSQWRWFFFEQPNDISSAISRQLSINYCHWYILTIL